MSRITLKTVDDELARRGYTVRLAKGSGYFYFQFGEAADWPDRSVSVSTVSSQAVDSWIEEFQRLQQLKTQIIGETVSMKAQPKRPVRSKPDKTG
jgi:hypothetical protein